MAADIMSPLCYVLNTYIITGTFPSSWKLAKVTPLYKKGKSDSIDTITQYLFYQHCQNYWRLRHVHQALYKCLTDADLLVPHQSGFHPQHPCTTALTSITDSWLKSINEGKMIATLFIDRPTESF